MKIKKFTLPALTLIVGLILGALISQWGEPGDTSKNEIRQQGYTFISPLIDCHAEERRFAGLTKKLKDELSSFIKEHPQVTASVYVRDLLNGPVISLQGDVAYSPASLTKVPVMMAYLKHSEVYPAILTKELEYQYAEPLGLLWAPEVRWPNGGFYKVEDLIAHMIVHSDNGARAVLIKDVFQGMRVKGGVAGNSVPMNAYSEIFTALGLGNSDQSEPKMTVGQVATIFRVLFNASYLNRENSERALRLMSKTRFSAGLRAGVPPEVPVSHKFGENYVNGAYELHDCGIVYRKKGPYLLCVMTRSVNEKTLPEVIKGVSRIVHNHSF